jgi:glycosyltransferase involved in cell wall biosynthesis
MVKRVLMIAFHFPPLRGSSGIQRTLKFAQYLLGFGWNPVVLSAHPRAFANAGDDQLRDIPAEVPVYRAFALDTSRHLSIGGRYPGALALPDRWVSWAVGAVPAGWRLVRRYRPDVIWSTYPIATAHLIGLLLHRLTGIAWVADMRDPMTDDAHPTNPLTRRIYNWIERHTLARCSVAVCTTPGAIRTYRARYPALPAERFALIENGYDEENFAQAGAARPPQEGPFVLVHSGVIYPSERDPVPLFRALAALAAQGTLAPDNFKLVLRATGHDAYLSELVRQHGIEALVELAPHVSYREALSEMMSAGGLLILQAANCNHQVPAKLYEYLRAGRPILALTDPAGDTAGALRQAGIDSIAPLDSSEAIMQAIARFVPLARGGQAPLASAETVAASSRRARTAQLARLLDQVATQQSRSLT